MRKNISRKIRKNMKGITLIALVVTIVILLILTGIVLDVSIGDNAVLNRATEAAKKTKRAQVNDYLTMKKAEIEMDQFIDSQELLEDIGKLALDKRVVGVNNIKIQANISSINSPEDMLKDATVEATIKNGNSYYTTELKLGEIKNGDGSSNFDIGIGELKQVDSVSEADQIILAAIKAKSENRYDNQYILIPYKPEASGIGFIPTIMIGDNINNKYYVDQCKISYTESKDMMNILLSFKEVTLLPMKLKVNSGENCRVNFNMQYYRGTIDWGDGTQENIDKLQESETESEIKFKKVASISATTKRGYISRQEAPEIITHKYAEKNKEYEVTINAFCLAFNSGIKIANPEESTNTESENTTDQTSDDTIKIEDFEKITSIEDFGSIGAATMNFTNCDKLTNIASPNEYTFMFTSAMFGTFANCTSLETIPSDLFKNSNCIAYTATFMNCNKLKSIPENIFPNSNFVFSYAGCFYNCTGLTGNAPELWKNAITIHRGSAAESAEVAEDLQLPMGECCFYNCLNLTNYDDIPANWKFLKKEELD